MACDSRKLANRNAFPPFSPHMEHTHLDEPGRMRSLGFAKISYVSNSLFTLAFESFSRTWLFHDLVTLPRTHILVERVLMPVPRGGRIYACHSIV